MRSGTRTAGVVGGQDDLARLLGSDCFAWSILESLPGTAVIVFDKDLRVAAVGGDALPARGYEGSLMLGRELREILPAATYEQYAPHYASALAGERSVAEQATIDHERIYVTEFSPIRDSAGEIHAGLAIARDVTESRRVQSALAVNERELQKLDDDAHDMFETAFARAPTGAAMIDMDGCFLRVNSALCQLLARSAHQIIGFTPQAFTHPDDLQLTAGAFDELRAQGSTVSVEKRYVRPDGEVVWALTHGQAVKDAAGKARYIVSHFIDITAIRHAQQLQREASTHFETAFADAPIGMALVALDGRWLKVNRTLCELTGYAESDLLERTFQDITHPEDLDTDLAHVQRLLAGEADRYAMEKRYFTAAGYPVWVNLSVSIVRDQEKRPLHFICHIEDISARRDLQARLRRLADHDSLTELCNRRRFEEELHRQLARCRRYGEQAALLMIDLDGFKAINDTHGHSAGDDMLKAVARALSSSIRESDSIARIGGDEFAVIMANVAPENVSLVAHKLRMVVLATEITVAGERVRVDASIGAEPIDAHTSDEQAVMAKADAAMYRVKSRNASARTGAGARQLSERDRD